MSRKRIVHIPGRINGNGGEAECTVEALEVENPTGGPPVRTQYKVIKVSKQLPEGPYELTTIDGTMQVRFLGGHWLAAF